MSALYRYLAQADVLELGPDEAYGDDAEEGDQKQRGGAGGGGLGRCAVEADHGRGDQADLREPADDGELEDAGSAAEGQQQHDPGEGHAAQLWAGDKGARGFEIGHGDDQPHGQREAGDNAEIGEGVHGVEAGVKAAHLVSDGSPKLL